MVVVVDESAPDLIPNGDAEAKCLAVLFEQLISQLEMY